ncbi:MAG: hypothetical protein ACK5BE_04705 [Alphaproteobacteria bacterium]|jgi:hypothetical protein
MKFFTLLLLVMFFTTKSYASCVPKPGKEIQVNIDKSYSPIFDGSGIKQPGCILQSDGKVLGYTSYNYLCNLPSNEKVNLALSYDCCDTGPDSGDLLCTVRAKGVLGIASIHANGVGLSPIDKDARAVDDFVSTLQGDYVFSYYGASKKLLEYLADDKFKATVLNKREQLKAIAKNGTREDQRGYASNVLLQMGNENEIETVEQIVSVLETEDFDDEIIIPIIKKAANYPNHVDKIAPALLNFLKREYYDKNKAEAVFTTLEKLGKSMRPYIKGLLEYEYEWSDRGKYYDFEQRVAFRKRMNNLVCIISPEDTNTLERWKWQEERKAKQFKCPL